MKTLAVIAAAFAALFLQCEKRAADRPADVPPAGSNRAAATAAPTARSDRPDAKNMDEIFSSNGARDGLEYRLVGRLQKKGTHEGVNYPNDNIVIEYEVKNASGQNIILYSEGHSTETGAVVYVEPAAGGAVELSRKAFLEPAGKTCPARLVAVTPRGRLLKPGDVFRDKLYLELPLRAKTPFDDCEPATVLPPGAKTVKFCLGYQPAGDDVKTDEAGNINPLPEVKDQRLLCSETGALK